MLRKLSTGLVALSMAFGLSMVGCGDDDGATCGDGVVEGSEVCDDTNLNGQTCSDEGFTGGTLSCNATCNGFDTSMCNNDVCGDDTVNGTEECDGVDLDGTACEDLGYDGGTLSCDGMCSFDETACFMNCGDDTIQAGDEVCDGADLDMETCVSQGFDAGTLACATDCTAFDTLGCCDDGCPAEDDTQCTGDTLGTCTMGMNGCLDWVDTDCTSTGDICSGTPADCNPPCTSDCPTLGVTECVDATTLNTCADGGDGCNYWTPSFCTGGFCGDTPAACLSTGSGLACNDVYNLNGRTFPHNMPGEWDTGAYTFQGPCQDGANPLYLSYTLEGTGTENLVIEIDDNNGAYPEMSAWTTTEATGFCDGAQMTEIGCQTGSSGVQTISVDVSALTTGTVIYILAGGDGINWPLGDQDITVSEQTCGNGTIELTEGCDDGNTTAGDGCDATCQVEATYWCTGEPSICMVPVCGDGYLNVAGETCDDGNATAGDGCDDVCVIETGYQCTGEPSVCALSCGDGLINGTDVCDDGNATVGDGCDDVCAIEAGYWCTGEPSTCDTQYTTAAATYAWVDISTTGATVLMGDDDSDGPFPAGFSFPYYGQTFTDFYLGSNGYITFGAGSTDLGNDCPMNTGTNPPNIIALMWDDLDPGDSNDPAYYETFASCPFGGTQGCLVVSFVGYSHWPGPGSDAGTFQAILFADGSILMQFMDVGVESGSGSTTGIMGPVGSDGATDYNTCNTAGSLVANDAVCFSPPGVTGCQ